MQGSAQLVLLEAARTWPQALSGELSPLQLADLLFVGIPGLPGPGTHNLTTSIEPLAIPPAPSLPKVTP